MIIYFDATYDTDYLYDEMILENREILEQIEEIRDIVEAFLGEEVVVTNGKGKKRNVIDGILEAIYPNVFTVTYRRNGSRLRESFQYRELATDLLSVVVKRTGEELVPVG